MNKPIIVVIGLSGMSAFMKVNHFHNVGETLHANDFHLEPGGKGYNQAVACQRLGGETYFISSVCYDDYGRICEERLKKEGVKPILSKSMGKSAFATILTNKNGDNQVTVYKGDSKLNVDFIKEYEHIIKTADILLLQFEVDNEVNQIALDIAHKYSISVILNPAPRKEFDIKSLNANMILTPNEFEAKTIFGLKSLDYSKLPPNTIVTMGDKGCLVVEKDKVTEIPALKVDVKDTTGAGDTFNAGLAVALGSGKFLLDAAKFAITAASLSVTKDYVLNSIPYLDEVIKNL